MTSPIFLLAAIAGAGVALGGVLVWARQRQRRANATARREREQAATRLSRNRASEHRPPGP